MEKKSSKNTKNRSEILVFCPQGHFATSSRLFVIPKQAALGCEINITVILTAESSNLFLRKEQTFHLKAMLLLSFATIPLCRKQRSFTLKTAVTSPFSCFFFTFPH
jgi:hypothetical protein